MNKQELVSELSKNLNITQKSCRQALDGFLEEVVEALEEGKNYSQTGFGSFRTELKQERVSYNPALKKKMILPRKKRIKFRPSSKLKERINE